MAIPGQHHDWQQAFLDAFREEGVVLYACRAAGVSHTTVNDARKTDAAFREAFEQARDESVQILEREARRRAAEGTVRPVFHQGVEVGGVREYSDTLLMFLLKAARPDVYNPTIRVDIRREAERIATELGMTEDDVLAAVAEVERMLAGAGVET